MALSQTQQEQSLGQGYTHKKFNCGYSHKKLGRRLRQREPVKSEQIVQEEKMNTTKSNKDIFRPYALDENNASKKRKTSQSTEDSLIKSCTSSQNTTQGLPNIINQPNIQQSMSDPLQINTSCPTILVPIEPLSSPPLSPNSYNMRLQRQRDALYLRYLTQLQHGRYAASLQTTNYYPMGYPNVTAPIFNGC